MRSPELAASTAVSTCRLVWVRGLMRSGNGALWTPSRPAIPGIPFRDLLSRLLPFFTRHPFVGVSTSGSRFKEQRLEVLQFSTGAQTVAVCGGA
jgi:hypothetical protein